MKFIDLVKDIVYTITFAHNNFMINFMLWWSIMAPFAIVFTFFGDTELWKSLKIYFGFDFCSMDTGNKIFLFMMIALLENFI